LDRSFTEPCGSPCAVGDEVQEDDNTDEIEHETEFWYEKSGAFFLLPSIAEAEVGHKAIKKILKPCQKNGPGHEHHGFDELTHSHLKVYVEVYLWGSNYALG